MDKQQSYRFLDFIESFAIMAKYDDSGYVLDANHDIIYAGKIDLQSVSNEDMTRLKQLGWHIDEDEECFAIYT